MIIRDESGGRRKYFRSSDRSSDLRIFCKTVHEFKHILYRIKKQHEMVSWKKHVHLPEDSMLTSELTNLVLVGFESGLNFCRLRITGELGTM